MKNRNLHNARGFQKWSYYGLKQIKTLFGQQLFLRFLVIRLGLVVFLLCGFGFGLEAQQQEQQQSEAKEEVVIPGLYKMPEVSESLKGKPAVQKSAAREDLHKFMGYEILPVRYFSIPFDVFINVNFDGFFTDVGFLLLVLIPILFLWPSKQEDSAGKYSFLLLGAVMLLLSFLLLISVSSAYMNKHKLTTPEQSLQHLAGAPETGILNGLNKSIIGTAIKMYSPVHSYFERRSSSTDKITYPLLILLFVLISVLTGLRFRNQTKPIKTLIAFLMVYLFLWWILGSGGAWYGMLLFCISYIFVLKGIIARAKSTRFTIANVPSYALLGICILWIIMALVFRTVNYNPLSLENGKYIYIPPIIEYQTGNIDYPKLKNFCFPQHGNVTEFINKDDESLVYMVGTSMKYFVKKNDRRVFKDTFLAFFEKMVKKFKDKKKIMQALKASGFEYIVVDLDLGSADYTPDKSLSRKFIQLMNSLYDNPEVELVTTNRKIKLNSNGQIVNAVFENQGVIVERGHTALFRLK